MRRDIRSDLDVMLWTGVFQLVILSTFLAGWALRDALTQGNSMQAVPIPPQLRQDAVPAEAPLPPPVMAERVPKVDLDIPAPAAGENVSRKTADGDFGEPAGADEPLEEAAGAFDQEEPGDVTGPEGRNGSAMGAILRMDRRNDSLRIGSFETVTLEGGAEQCLDMGRMLLEDAGAGEDRLEILAQSRAVTMARICASNGSVVITCRRGLITISPRRLKPSESCPG